MLKKIYNKLFPKIIKAKYHYDDRLMFVFYSNGKIKAFKGIGVFWKNIENGKRCDVLMIDVLSKIKIQMDKTGKNYVDLTQENI